MVVYSLLQFRCAAAGQMVEQGSAAGDRHGEGFADPEDDGAAAVASAGVDCLEVRALDAAAGEESGGSVLDGSEEVQHCGPVLGGG